MHLALANTVAETVVLALVAAWPGATAVSNEYDFTPLHIAMSAASQQSASTRSSFTKVILALVGAYPDAIKKKGGDVGTTPLHMALQEASDGTACVEESVLLAMIDSCPVSEYKINAFPHIPRPLGTTQSTSVETATSVYSLPVSIQALLGRAHSVHLGMHLDTRFAILPFASPFDKR